MIFELKEKKDKFLEEMYSQAIKELDHFFKLNWNFNKPRIIIVKDRKEIDKLKGKKTPSWVVGWAEGQTVYLLDRKNFEKESDHKYSKEKYYRLLKHEICHLFFRMTSNINTRNQFIWFNEGVAGYLSEQWKEKASPRKFEKFLDQYSNWRGNAYNESTYSVKILAEKFGKQKLLTLIKSLPIVKSEQDFNKLFKKIYGTNPTYTFFNNLLKK